MNTIFNRILLVTFLLLALKPVKGQVMLNGSFENNTAPLICNYNLLDANFNNFMSNVTAFGAFTGGGNEIDLLLAGCNVPTIPNGLFCIALANVPSDAVAIRLSSPLVQGGVYQFYFWAYSDTTLRVQGDVEVGLSNASQAFGVPIYTAATIPSTWVYYTVNFTAPIAGKYITVRNKSGPTHWNRVDAFSFDTCSMNLYLGEDTTLCLGETVSLDASAFGSSFLWQDGSTNPGYTVNMPGIYWVNVTEDGCTWRDSIVVDYAQAATLNLGNDTTLCEGDSLVLNASQPNALYQWQNASDDSVYTVTTTGLYWVNITRNNCVSRDSIIVFFNPMPEVDLGTDTTLCNGDTVILNAQSGSGSYQWQDGDTNNIYIVSQSGIYWVDITLDNCTMRDSIQLFFNTQPPVTLGNDTLLCAGDSLTLTVFAPGYSYNWVTNSSDSAITVTQSGIYWVDVTGNRCTTRDSILIIFSPYPNVDLGNDTTVCDGVVITLNLSIPNASYQWQDNSAGNIYNVSGAGIYWVEATVNNCSSRDSINIQYSALPVVNIGNDTALCENSPLVIDASGSGVSYQWNNSSTDSVITINQSGIYWVDVTTNNCTTRDSINILFNPNPIVDLGNDTTLCYGDLYQLNLSIPNASYQWHDNTSGNIYNVQSAGIYWVDATVNNCTSRDSIEIDYFPLPVVNIGNDTVLCEDATLVIDAPGSGGSYLWNNNSTDSIITINQSGNYWVDVTINNCTSRDTIIIDYENNPEINLGENSTICEEATIVLDAGIGNAVYQWQDGSSNQTYIVTQPGTYWVTVAVNNCSGSDEIIIEEEICEPVLIMPNTFTPNNDGQNENFVPIEMREILSAVLTIYNRWGAELFQTSDIKSGWNGKNKNGESIAGTYYWTLTYFSKNYKTYSQKGTLLLIK